MGFPFFLIRQHTYVFWINFVLVDAVGNHGRVLHSIPMANFFIVVASSHAITIILNDTHLSLLTHSGHSPEQTKRTE